VSIKSKLEIASLGLKIQLPRKRADLITQFVAIIKSKPEIASLGLKIQLPRKRADLITQFLAIIKALNSSQAQNERCV